MIEPLALADADRGPVEKLEDGAVALAAHREGDRGSRRAARLWAWFRRARGSFFHERKDEVQRGVLEDDALAQEEAEEPLHEGEVAPLRGERVGPALRALRLGKEPRPRDDVLLADRAQVPDALLP